MIDQSEDKKSLSKAIWHIGVMVLVVAGISVTAEHVGQGHLTQFTNWVQDQGTVAPLIFGFINVLAIIAFIPQTLFTLTAGLLFGPVIGVATSVASLTVGGAACFLISRHGGRDYMENRFGHLSIFKKLNRLSVKHPIKIVAISRLVPIFPIPLLSYIWGLTKVNFWIYLIMTMICPIPETIFLTTGGHLLKETITAGSLDLKNIAILAGAGIFLVLVILKAGKMLADDDEDDHAS